ncbi:MAG: ribosome small subunit-dependent GTPase A [Anaerolineaceae bacterium]|nr:ribosome small subunit-dependent GTPase A [Anaerolineaceae bacterium]
MNIENTDPKPGVVFMRTRETYYVQIGRERILCTASTKLKQEIVVGDFVVWDDKHRITTVRPRHNQFSRRAAGTGYQQQIIAANVDQVLIVMSVAKPRPRWNLLDRYLVSAEFAVIPALICLTKMDLVQGTAQREEIEAVASEYASIGYDIILTSTQTCQGIDELRSQIQASISALVGQSGVGKTSLINALEPELALRTQDVSHHSNKGRHTTTTSQIYPLPAGGFMMDTPGIREFGMWDMTEEDLIYGFPEMRPYQHACKFSDCSHHEEPGCQVRQAVMEGDISPYRYQSYLKLREDL